MSSDMMTPAQVVKKLRGSFDSGKTRPLSYRKKQLNNLMSLLDVEVDTLSQALHKDLRKPNFESQVGEMENIKNAIREMIIKLDSWAADEHVDKSLVTLLDTTYIHREPLGVVLVIAPWNYPLMLSLQPVAAAIAAGNVVLLKPSELTQETSKALKQTIERYLDPDCVMVYEGGVQETTELLKQRFDHIFFTGGPNVGRIVARAASAHLTPCTLELGGKSPLYLDENVSNIEIAAKRLIWGKCINSGQTCIAPDYVLCSQKAEDRLLKEIRRIAPLFFTGKPQESLDLSRIVNQRHFERLTKLIERTNGDLVFGGAREEKDLFIDLHVYTNVKGDDALMEDEIFGPILPIVRADSVEEAINFINLREKPLSLYVFSESKKVREAFINQTSSGAVCVNDVIVHITMETLPFGGVGNSGYGAYHGKTSFDTFSHKKSVLLRDYGFFGEFTGKLRYPPYNEQNMKAATHLLKRRNFPSFPGFAYLACAVLGAAVAIASMSIISAYEN